MPGIRLDRALVERGLVRSRGRAQELIGSGRVRLNGRIIDRASTIVGAGDELEAIADHYVSRGAHKLIGVLDELGPAPDGPVLAGRALDAGASTGGFTQVLLEHGCAPVYAVDVGTDQLDPVLRADPRVITRERTSLRELTLEHLDGEPVDVVVADLSFIPLGLVLDRLVAVCRSTADLILLVKPQFEVGRSRLGKNGVVRDPRLREEAVREVAAAAAGLGRPARRCVRSRHRGAGGNVEFFLWLGDGPAESDPFDGVDFA